MFEFHNIEFARQQVVAIAAERVAHISAEDKAQALARIDIVLEQWKSEQAASDGTIEVRRWPFGGFPGGGLLGDFARWDEPIHKPAEELKPEECAGPFVKCASDLFSKLAYEGHPAAVQVRDNLRIDVVTALLLERDGMKMPADSIASALRMIWIWVWELGKAYRAQAVESEMARAEHLTNIQLESATTRAERKRANWDKWRQMSDKIKSENAPKTMKRFAVASTIRERLQSEGVSDLPTISTIEDALKGSFR